MDPEYAGPAGAADTGFGRWGFLRGAAMLIDGTPAILHLIFHPSYPLMFLF